MSDTRLADAVIAWFDANARDLPWRRPTATPWGVLVSEVMLQQTPVSRVEPVWLAWLERWPTPADLASEPVAEVIRAWGRLGYPRRAVRLHTCATVLAEQHDNTVPDDLDTLLALPGIGTYTARAVATFAYGQRHPVVDTNVRRVVARAVSGRRDPGPSLTPADLTTTAALLPLEVARAARASAAFMELGALICVSRTPECTRCPLLDSCAWVRAGSPPASTPRRPSQRFTGTDRQVRGLIMAVLREATGPVPAVAVDAVWPDAQQRNRALAGLITDGLARPAGAGHYALPL